MRFAHLVDVFDPEVLKNNFLSYKKMEKIIQQGMNFLYFMEYPQTQYISCLPIHYLFIESNEIFEHPNVHEIV